LLVLSFIAPLASALVGGAITPLLLLSPIAYALVTAIASVQVALRSGRLAYARVLPAVLATLHISYGLGVLIGLVGMLADVIPHSRAPEEIAQVPSTGSRKGAIFR
jgi:hypothetical protein